MPPTTPADFLRALRRREPLRAGGQTDALRLLDGAGDGRIFAGLFIDDFARRWLVQTTQPGQEPPAFLRDPPPATGAPRSIYWKRLDSRDQHQQPPVHWAANWSRNRSSSASTGSSSASTSHGGYSQGLFFDQRDNRLALRQRMHVGATLLNCFAYTGAFSVAAAAGGAGTTSVDLSRRSLDWGEENFRLNGWTGRGAHISRRRRVRTPASLRPTGASLRRHRARSAHVLAGSQGQGVPRGGRFRRTRRAGCAAARVGWRDIVLVQRPRADGRNLSPPDYERPAGKDPLADRAGAEPRDFTGSIISRPVGFSGER